MLPRWSPQRQSPTPHLFNEYRLQLNRSDPPGPGPTPRIAVRQPHPVMRNAVNAGVYFDAISTVLTGKGLTMPDCLRSLVAAAAAALLVPALLGTAASRNFVPDYVFTGSTLTGWKPLGSAAWRAQNGEIIATPNGGGWLIAEPAYQDVAFSASFRCADGCSAGVLLRAERTPDGGLKGIYASLVADDLVSYRVTIDSTGKETSRDRLRPAGGGQVRVAPPPAPASGGCSCRRTERGTWRWRTGRCGSGRRRARCRASASADAGRYRAAHRPARHRPAVRPVERSRARPRCQHPARVSQRRRRLERWRRRRRVRALRRHRALRRRYRRRSGSRTWR